MAIKKPYHRLYRPMIEGRYGGNYQHDYNFAKDPTHYTRSFFMIQDDIKKLFRYIEPADQNLQTYSLEIYQLLLRTTTEVEANFKAILRENEYNKSKNLNIHDYKKINHSHHLDAYSAEFPIWTGEKKSILLLNHGELKTLLIGIRHIINANMIVLRICILRILRIY